MEIDFKKTIWDRVHVPEDLQSLVINKLKLGYITTPDEILAISNRIKFEPNMLETDEYINTEENDNQETISVLMDGVNIWNNKENLGIV